MKQAEDDLEVIIKAKNLCVHSIRLTSNPKKFPKKYRFSLCSKIQNKSISIYENLLEANRTLLSDKRKRNELQTKAILYCDELLFYIELCIELKIVESGSGEYWSKLVSDIKHMAIAWRTSDKER